MADDKPEDATPAAESNPLADKIRRAIAAHPVLRDQKKLEVNVHGRRVHLEGTVFTLFMYNQLIEMLARIPGIDQVVFDVEPEIHVPERRTLEGHVPRVSQGPSPSDPFYSAPWLRPRRKKS